MATKPSRASRFTPTGVVDMHGNPYFKGDGANQAPNRVGGDPPGGDGPSGGSTVITLSKLEERSKGAFLWLSLLTFACGIAFLFLITTISSGFDKVSERVGHVEKTVDSQSATLEAVQATANRIESKLARG